MGLIKPLHKIYGQETLWPVQPWSKVASAVMLNMPVARGKQTLSFVLKEVVKDSVPMTLFIQSTGHSGFMATQKQSETDRIADYAGTHKAQLRDIGLTLDDAAVLTVVGRLKKHEGRETFVVYYLILNNIVFLDEVSIKRILLYKQDKFDDFLLAMLASAVLPVTVDNNEGYCVFEELDNLHKGSFIGLPVSTVEERGVNDRPILRTTPHHMRFMAFSYKRN